MKKLFAILLASSLASIASSSASELENQYYAGLNFGGGWGTGLKIKPGLVFGYNYDKSSKFELEILTDVSDMFGKETKKMGASLLANYRYYPDVNIDPVKLYVSGGLGGHLAITFNEKQNAYAPLASTVQQADMDPAEKDAKKKKEEEERKKKEQEDARNRKEKEEDKTLDKILDAISYKLKVGVDYEITPQIIGTAGISVGGQLSGLKAMAVPDMMLEVGVRYNF